MKLFIVAINSKYTHTSLSARCLYHAVKGICDASFAEYTINDSIEEIISDIHSRGADCVAFSCYIWNIGHILKAASVLKRVNPHINIALGGHEAEHDAEAILRNNPFIDAVLHGEGEISLRNYVKLLSGTDDAENLSHISYRRDNEIICLDCPCNPVDLNELEFVYGEEIDSLKNRIIYYETSRGCPYNCTYCISGESRKVRYLDAERVKKELLFFMEHKVPLVKFVDRTFNADVKRAKTIFEFIADNPSDTCSHMELSGALIDRETLDILSRVKKGGLQFEIGVQTTNSETMKAISRSVSFEKLKSAVCALMEMGNIHIHLDLIAGLPREDICSFRRSFDEVIALRPHALQLGFLKMLKGSAIRRDGDKYGYIYRDYPPYEVISNDFISYDELNELKITEVGLDKYYNSGNFKNSLRYVFDCSKSPYEVLYKLGKHLKEGNPAGYAYSVDDLFKNFTECFSHFGEEVINKLKIDYLICRRPGKRPQWMGDYNKKWMDYAYHILKDEELKKDKFPNYYDVPAKEIMKHIHPEMIGGRFYLFDYKDGKYHDATEFLKLLD